MMVSSDKANFTAMSSYIWHWKKGPFQKSLNIHVYSFGYAMTYQEFMGDNMGNRFPLSRFVGRRGSRFGGISVADLGVAVVADWG